MHVCPQQRRGVGSLHRLYANDCRAVRLLCDADADVNVRDLVGRSPLWLAVSKDEHVSQVKALLSNKLCELNISDRREKRTALQVTFTQIHS